MVASAKYAVVIALLVRLIWQFFKFLRR